MKLLTAILLLAVAAPAVAQDCLWQPTQVVTTPTGCQLWWDGTRWVQVCTPQQSCPPVQQSAPQQRPAQSEWSAPAPLPGPSIPPTASNGFALLPWRDQMEKKILALELRVNALAQRAPQAGPAGPQGPVGAQGPPGAQGPAGKDGAPAQVDVEALAAAILKTLPPQRVEWTTLSGEVLKQEKPLGQPLKFKSVEVGVK